jgi:hypothetical protein
MTVCNDKSGGWTTIQQPTNDREWQRWAVVVVATATATAAVVAVTKTTMFTIHKVRTIVLDYGELLAYWFSI